MRSITVSKTDDERFQRTWRELRSYKFSTDWKEAKLVKEVHDIFSDLPKAIADEEFRKYVKSRFEGCHSDTLLRKALVFDQYDEQAWTRFGGWRGIRFLSSLKKSDRYRVIAALHGKGPFHYKTILKRAESLNIFTPNSQGPQRTSVTAAKLNELRNYIDMLKRTVPNLPPMRPEAEAAMSDSKHLKDVVLAGARA